MCTTIRSYNKLDCELVLKLPASVDSYSSSTTTAIWVVFLVLAGECLKAEWCSFNVEFGRVKRHQLCIHITGTMQSVCRLSYCFLLIMVQLTQWECPVLVIRVRQLQLYNFFLEYNHYSWDHGSFAVGLQYYLWFPMSRAPSQLLRYSSYHLPYLLLPLLLSYSLRLLAFTVHQVCINFIFCCITYFSYYHSSIFSTLCINHYYCQHVFCLLLHPLRLLLPSDKWILLLVAFGFILSYHCRCFCTNDYSCWCQYSYQLHFLNDAPWVSSHLLDKSLPVGGERFCWIRGWKTYPSLP